MPVSREERDLLRRALAICTRVPELARSSAAAMRSPVPLNMARIAARVVPEAQATTWITDRDERALLGAALLVAIDIVNELAPPRDDEPPPSDRRDQVIQVRLSAAELEEVRRRSQAAGQTMSEYTRERLLGEVADAE